jgi:hypothetical protein
MTLAQRDHETLAASLRRHGTPVDEPKADNLREELQATLDRIRAGETLAELSRRDPEALCALAMERPLTEQEARMLLAAVRYRDGLLTAAERSLASERDWARCQRENADLWARDCAKLGKVLVAIAAAAKAPQLAESPDALAGVVTMHAEAVQRFQDWVIEMFPAMVPSGQSPLAFFLDYLARSTGRAKGLAAQARPVDANTAAIARASNELGALRELARGVAELLGEPGLEQEPERLRALLVERMAVDDSHDVRPYP